MSDNRRTPQTEWYHCGNFCLLLFIRGIGAMSSSCIPFSLSLSRDFCLSFFTLHSSLFPRFGRKQRTREKEEKEESKEGMWLMARACFFFFLFLSLPWVFSFFAIDIGRRAVALFYFSPLLILCLLLQMHCFKFKTFSWANPCPRLLP